jgi:hypothetical protein
MTEFIWSRAKNWRERSSVTTCKSAMLQAMTEATELYGNEDFDSRQVLESDPEFANGITSSGQSTSINHLINRPVREKGLSVAAIEGAMRCGRNWF